MGHTGAKIRKIRELRNLTQDYVAGRLGISQSNYARIEKDNVGISDERLQQLAEILGTTAENIEGFDEQVVFNISSSTNVHAINNVRELVNHYHISAELKQLYEDKIRLLEEKITHLERAQKVL
ncbi:MAG: helix-turn-helix transcriptional regulator [Chitinophagaceae bacterium]|nr:helix-turn-helix transcriptional regulator [Chitinophagaceae bacterium]